MITVMVLLPDNLPFAIALNLPTMSVPPRIDIRSSRSEVALLLIDLKQALVILHALL